MKQEKELVDRDTFHICRGITLNQPFFFITHPYRGIVDIWADLLGGKCGANLEEAVHTCDNLRMIARG